MADTSGTRRERRAAQRVERQERERADAARARQRKRLFQLGGALALAAAIIVVIVIATGGGSSDDGKPALRAGETVAGSRDAVARFAGIDQRGITLGDPRAPVTMVEFADLQCPFCRDYTATTFPTLVDQYVRTGKVKMEFRNLAFIGTDSTRAAQMAEAVGQQNQLWPFIDTFYANQETENSGFVTDEFLRRIAGAIPGVDVQRAYDDRGVASVQRQLDEASSEATRFGITGTPSFLIGRTGGDLEVLEVRSGFPLEDYTGPIDRLLAQR
jgi:protein-disulfide isomerase